MSDKPKPNWYEPIADQHATQRAKERNHVRCSCGACETARSNGYRPKID